MTNNSNNKSSENPKMLSIDELKSYPGFEHKSDAELMEIAEFLKEFSLILFNAYVKQTAKEKSI